MTSKKATVLKLVIVGALAGAFIGSGFGIAGHGAAVAATLPLAFVGGYLGYRTAHSTLWVSVSSFWAGVMYSLRNTRK